MPNLFTRQRGCSNIFRLCPLAIEAWAGNSIQLHPLDHPSLPIASWLEFWFDKFIKEDGFWGTRLLKFISTLWPSGKRGTTKPSATFGPTYRCSMTMKGKAIGITPSSLLKILRWYPHPCPWLRFPSGVHPNKSRSPSTGNTGHHHPDWWFMGCKHRIWWSLLGCNAKYASFTPTRGFSLCFFCPL